MTPDFSGARWKKSTRSDESGGGQCVEVAFADGHIGVRDSKAPAADLLTFDPTAWQSFTRVVKAGLLDG